MYGGSKHTRSSFFAHITNEGQAEVREETLLQSHSVIQDNNGSSNCRGGFSRSPESCLIQPTRKGGNMKEDT